VECLQSGRDAWTTVAALTLQRTSLTAAAMDGTVYAIGGQVRMVAALTLVAQYCLMLPRCNNPSTPALVLVTIPQTEMLGPENVQPAWWPLKHTGIVAIFGEMPCICRNQSQD